MTRTSCRFSCNRATGTAGQGVLQQRLLDREVEQVLSMLRGPAPQFGKNPNKTQIRLPFRGAAGSI
ncbi:MAG TPA: hypothetical protein VGF76_26530 [Polyangiaceae bacterium]